MDSAPPRPPDRPIAAWTARLVVALVGWMLADLWLGRDLLPGAPSLEHVAFRAVVGPLEWLTEDSGVRLLLALGGAAALAVAGVVGRRRPWGRGILRCGAAGLAGGLVFVAVLGLLMERALAGGIVAAVVALAFLDRGSPRTTGPSPHPRSVTALVVLAGLGALFWFYSVFMTYGEGYPLLQWLGAALRDGGISFLAVWAGLAAALGGASTAVLGPRDRPALARVGMAAAGGVVLVPILRATLGSGGPAWTALLVVPIALVLVRGLGPLLGGGSRFDPLSWPRLALLPAALGALLVSHAYAARVLACPEDRPFLTRLATPGELFRLAPGAGVVALSGREDRALDWLDPADGSLHRFAPGPLAARFPPGVAHDGTLAGNPEELVWSAQDRRWYATIVPADPFAYMPPGTPPDAEITNVLATIDPATGAVTDVQGFPGMCWINTLHAESDGLWLGCEDRPGLARVQHGEVTTEVAPSALGDVQDLAFSPDRERVWSISLWFRPTVTELRRDDLSIARQRRIGGTHYHLAHDPITDRLFASSWYGSRLRVIDAEDLAVEATLPLGFGGRAVTVDATRRLLLASSTYDGLLRVCDPDALTVRAALPVGGHIKDIAIDEDLGRAWFWSQCGLYELDLDGLVAWLERRES